MDIIALSKALSNETRVHILQWLKDPECNFPPHRELGHFRFGVCSQYIQDKAGLSQSTISHFLNMMEKAGLVIATRHGKWTYYKRNETTIADYIRYLRKEL